MNRAEYQDYLRSEHWQDVKRRFRASKLHHAGCYVCGSAENLNLHHKTYKRLGNERLTDLIYLCKPCHSYVHLLLKERPSSRTNLWNVARKVRKQHEHRA
jgi:5-methylcytosine-specific restriction endonuclease McrA